MTDLKERLENGFRKTEQKKEEYCYTCDAIRPTDEDGCILCSYNKEKARVEAEDAEKKWEWEKKSEAEKRAITQKKYQDKNKEQLKRYRQEYYQKNKEKKKQQSREQYAKLTGRSQ